MRAKRRVKLVFKADDFKRAAKPKKGQKKLRVVLDNNGWTCFTLKSKTAPTCRHRTHNIKQAPAHDYCSWIQFVLEKKFYLRKRN